ncbi:MAG: type II toxin-antitoxin system Phd/YefM family antitoxin [Rubrobacteraceae bacterium]|jgi:prevent-host-death family protein
MKEYVRTVNVHEAKTHLSRLLERVSMGEEIVIAKAGKPVARLVPEKKRTEPRKPGSAKGEITIHDSFYDPLPEDILRAFEGR